MPTKAGKSSGSNNTRNEILRVATELMIKHGYRGTNFRTIAEKVGITTTNIHYHFGGKDSLVEHVVKAFVAEAIARQHAIWANDSLTIREKLQAVVDSHRVRYLKYNKSKSKNRPWTLIGRLRMEMDALSLKTQKDLMQFPIQLQKDIERAVDMAIQRGELKSDAPASAIVIVLLAIANSSAAIAADVGFEQLEYLYQSTGELIASAYGR
ncbi:MAG TPA: TetR/AcrR family transcriptional regulator [Bellilinea sp.]|nr:TetR/AcrR family transcriptional regulator [Bellilinea sp.]